MSQQGQLHNVGTGAATIETLTGNSGGAVGPDASFNINILGNNTTGINVVGMPGTNTLTIIGIQATTTQRGTVELATDAEAIAGTDSVNTLTSSNLTAKLGAQTLNGLPIGAGTAAALTWTAAPTDGQLLIGDTGSTPVLGNLTSLGGTITITNGPGTINLETVGGTAIETIGGDSGSITGASVTIFAANASNNCGGSVKFTNSGTTSTLNVTDASANTFIGNVSGNTTLSGTNNCGFGSASSPQLTSGSNNVAIGTNSLLLTNSGNSNVGLGSTSLAGITSGSGNIGIGLNAGINYTGSESNNIIISNSGTAAESNFIRIGTQGSGSGQQNKCAIAGIVGVTPSNPTAVLINSSTGQLGNVTSANSAILATNSSGVYAMRALSVVTQVFTSSGTYTPTSGMLYCIIECVGGGGAGGGAEATTGAQTSGGSGGGAGEYARGVFSAATIGASKGVTIGAAGTANSGAAGGNGGNTVVGATTISANGGIGGSTSTAAALYNGTAVLGGTGGTGGDFRTPGDQGQYSIGNVANTLQNGGAGGSSKYGAGGLAATANSAGAAALGYGSGGSGALNFTSQSARSGGAGTAGIVIVTEYVIA